MDRIKAMEERKAKVDELEREFVEDFIKLRKDKHLTQESLANKSSVIRLTIT